MAGLNPTMDSVIGGPTVAPNIEACSNGVNADCWFGAENAPHTVVLTGDSIAMSYLAPMIAFANASGGQWKVLSQAAMSCPFISVAVQSVDEAIAESCPARKQHVVDNINRIRPDMVLISNTYVDRVNADTQQELTATDWKNATRQIITSFAGSAGRVALLTPPPADKDPAECYRPGSSPADCVGTLTPDHLTRVNADRDLAESIDGDLVDTWPLFCTASQFCPMFVGTTPVKHDRAHISPAYADLMAPAFIELLKQVKGF